MWLVAHTQQQNSHIILIQLLQHGSNLKIGQKFRAESTNPNITIFQYPLSSKNLWSSHKTTSTFLRTNTFHIQFKIPRNIMHELPHNHSRNPKHAHPLPYVGPYRNTCTNSRLFPNIRGTTQVLQLGFFSFSLFDQVLLLPIYNTPKSKSTHFFLGLLISFHFITPQPPTFISSACLQSSSFHLFASPKSLY